MKRVSFLFLIFASVSLYAAGMKIEIIPLKHRLVQDVLPAIQPLVEQGGTVTGMNNQIIVKSTPSNIAQIKQVLNSLDAKARQLQILVTQDISGIRNRTESGLSGSIGNDNVRITSPDTSNRGASVTIGDENNAIRYRHLSSRSSIEDNNAYRVTTLEGSPAFIQTGVSIPLPQQRTTVGAGGVSVQNSVQYENVSSGFYATPQLNGDNVTLFISSSLDRVTPNQGSLINTQQAQTTVQGKLGEWIQVGGTSQQFNDSGRRNVITTRNSGEEHRSIYLKVIEVN